MGAEEVRPPGGQGLGDDDGVHIRSFPFGAEDRAGCPSPSATAQGCLSRGDFRQEAVAMGGRLLPLCCLSRAHGPIKQSSQVLLCSREAQVLPMPPEVRILAPRLLIWEPRTNELPFLCTSLSSSMKRDAALGVAMGISELCSTIWDRYPTASAALMVVSGVPGGAFGLQC